MTTFPGAQYRPLDRVQRQARIAHHDIVCLHTMVGYLTSTDTLFKRNGWGGTESHFGIGGKWGPDREAGLDGEIYQWQDTEFRADANLDGNRRIISIETADNAPNLPSQIEPWTPKQLDAIVAVTAWACKKYDIPAVMIHDSKPGRRGIGYHRLGCQHSRGPGVPGFLVPGGERWSNAVGKECPGPRRIAQIPGIVARVKATLATRTDTIPVRPAPQPATPTPVQEDDMKWTDKVALTATDATVWTQHAKATGSTATFKAGDLVTFSDMVRYPTLSRRIHLDLIKLQATLSNHAAPPVTPPAEPTS